MRKCIQIGVEHKAKFDKVSIIMPVKGALKKLRKLFDQLIIVIPGNSLSPVHSVSNPWGRVKSFSNKFVIQTVERRRNILLAPSMVFLVFRAKLYHKSLSQIGIYSACYEGRHSCRSCTVHILFSFKPFS